MFDEENDEVKVEKIKEEEVESRHEEERYIAPKREPKKQTPPFWGGIIAISLTFSVLFGALGGFLGYSLGNRGSTVVINQPVPETPIGEKQYYDAVVDVVNKVSPAVVSITTESTVDDRLISLDDPFDLFGRQMPYRNVPRTQMASGSGVIIKNTWTDDQGYILTNNHVVDGAQKITVHLKDKRRFDARVVATDPLSDLAVIKVNEKNLPMAELGDSSKLKVGQPVVAIGNPYQYEFTVTTGVVSALERTLNVPSDDRNQQSKTLVGVIQTDAAINPGNSGGPLVSLDGKVIGINTVIIAGAQNLGFAVSSNTATRVAEDLIKFGKVAWPFLGVSGTTMTEELAKRLGIKFIQGAYIAEVLPGAAREGGMLKDDVITAVNDKPIEDFEQLLIEVRQHKVGEKIKLKIDRKGKEMTLEITLGTAPR